MKTIIKILHRGINLSSFRTMKFILTINFLIIVLTENVNATVPTFTCSTSNGSYTHTITDASAAYDLNVCAAGDVISVTVSNFSPCSSYDNLDWSWSTTCDVSNPGTTAHTCNAVAGGGTITLSFSGNGCSNPYTVIINVYVAQCPIFKASTTTTFTGTGNIVLCSATSSDCDLSVYAGDAVTFEILTNHSSASSVTFTSTYSCGSMPSGAQSLPVTSWSCTFSSPGDYTITATYSSCASCNSESIIMHVGKCPLFKAENLSNSCTYPTGVSCSPGSTACDMYIMVGDQLRFSVLANNSYCAHVSFATQYASCGVPSASDLPVSSYTCTYSSIGNYNISATFSNGTCSNVSPANTSTCACVSSCTATITIHVLGAFETASHSATSTLTACSSFSLTNINNTGNDKRKFTISSNTYDVEVNVWDGDNPGLGWHMKGSSDYYGCIALNSDNDAVDPDVCLVRGCHGSSCSMETFFAIVVYHSSSEGGYIWKAFYWDTSTNEFLDEGISVLLSSASFAHSINIDSDQNENWAVIWDESNSSSYDVYANIGSAGAGAQPAILCMNGSSPDNFLVVQDGKMPDVSLYYDGSSTEKLRMVWAKIIGGGDGVKMSEANFSDISNNCTTAENYLSDVFTGTPVSGHAYSYPRIASPNSNGTVDQYCVVLEDFHNDGSDDHYYITGYTSSDASTFNSPLKHTYNDGSALASPADISLVPNNRPVVTFDKNAGYVYIGWTFKDNPDLPGYVFGLGSAGAEYPIILVRDIKGESTECLKYWKSLDHWHQQTKCVIFHLQDVTAI